MHREAAVTAHHVEADLALLAGEAVAVALIAAVAAVVVTPAAAILADRTI